MGPKGNLIYSVKSIDDYPSEANYARVEGRKSKSKWILRACIILTLLEQRSIKING